MKVIIRISKMVSLEVRDTELELTEPQIAKAIAIAKGEIKKAVIDE